MKIIKILSEKIEEEIADAKSYIKMAMLYKDEYPELSRTLYSIANQEVDHMNMLHDEVVSLIKKYRSEQGDPPSAMLAVYDYLHEQQIEHYGEVKILMDAYKNG